MEQNDRLKNNKLLHEEQLLAVYEGVSKMNREKSQRSWRSREKQQKF